MNEEYNQLVDARERLEHVLGELRLAEKKFEMKQKTQGMQYLELAITTLEATIITHEKIIRNLSR